VKRIWRTAAVLGVAALVAAGCGGKPSNDNSSGNGGGSSPSAAGKALKACMVLDVGGVDDRSFNQSSWQGMQDANAANSNIKTSYVSSSSQNDYVPNLTQEVNGGCQTTIAVGGLMTDAMKSTAGKNPDKKFAIIDSNTGQKNVYGIQFNTAQGAFLGGYLAAGMTKTGKVATFGGLNIPPVTIYMDGFWEGVQYYNKQKHKNVKVLGWNEKNQKGGTFANSFTDQGKGRSVSQAFIQQGADIIFPVAGGTGLGAAAAAKATGGKVNLLWVDFDGCKSAPEYCQYFISSVTKNIPAAVKKYVTNAADGTFPTGTYIGTLDNGGTGLAPYHQFDSKVPSSLKSEIDKLKQDIIDGKITITSPAQPK